MKILMKSKVFTLALVLILISCSSDDNGGGGQAGIELAGTWVLTQINLSGPVDANNDGNSSADLLDEVDCLRDTLVLDETLAWNSTEVAVNTVTQITGNLIDVNCPDERNLSGNWGVSGVNLILVGSVNRTFLISGDQLIENLAQDLPGILTRVYIRQQ